MNDHVHRLYRSRTDRMIAGICGGLGKYWDIDPVALRLVWLLITIFTGVVPGVISYVLAIIVIPLDPDERIRVHVSE